LRMRRGVSEMVVTIDHGHWLVPPLQRRARLPDNGLELSLVGRAAYIVL
jgi:hypothetical protein